MAAINGNLFAVAARRIPFALHQEKEISEGANHSPFPISERAEVEMEKEVESKIILARLLERKRRLTVPGSSKTIEVAIRDHTADEMTTASLSAIQTMSFALRHQKAFSLRRIDAAIERFRNGQYGKCLDCGIEIDSKRLEILPEAELCLECQESNEA